MKNLFFPLMMVLLVAACAPRDVAMSGGSGGGNGKVTPATVSPDEVVIVQNNGELPKTCPNTNAYKTIDSPIASDNDVFAGKVTASFAAGDRNCFRIGDVIDLQDHVNNGPSRGKVKILRVEILAATAVTADQAKAFNLDLATFKQNVLAELARVKAIPKGQPGGFDPKGMVAITFFQYLGKDGNTPPPTGNDNGSGNGNNGSGNGNSGNGSTTTTGENFTVDQDGQLPKTCTGKPYLTIDSPKQYDNDVFAGKVTASFAAGDRDCFKIGDTIDLQDRTGGASRGKVKITRVDVLPATDMTESQAKAFNTTLADLKKRVQDEFDRIKAIPKGQPGAFDPKGMVAITYFKYLGIDGNGTLPGGPPPVQVVQPPQGSGAIVQVTGDGHVAPTCPQNFKPSTVIYLPESNDADIISGKLIGVMRAGEQNCFTIGSTVSLQAPPKFNGDVEPERAKLKIAWVEIIPVDKLNNDHAQILNTTLDAVRTQAAALLQEASAVYNPKNTVNITVFEYVAGSNMPSQTSPTPVTNP